MNTKRKVLSILFIFSITTIYGQFSLENITGGSNNPIAIPFTGTIEAKKKQLDDSEKKLLEIQKNFEISNKENNQTIKIIDKEITETKKQLKAEVEPEEKEYLNKKITILNDRKQNLNNYQELLQQTEEIIKKNIKLINEIISFHEIKDEKEEGKPAYSWKELQNAQNKIYELIAKINSWEKLLDSLKNQKFNAKENLFSLQKQKDLKTSESEDISNKIKDISKEESEESRKTLKLKAIVINEESSLIKEKIEYSNLLNEKLNFEIEYKKNELEYKKNQSEILKNKLEEVKDLLILEIEDIESAKSESQNQTQKALQIKENLNKQRDKIKLERDKNYTELDNLKAELKNLNELEEDQQDKPKIYFLETNIQKQKSIIQVLNSELYLIDIKKDLADLSVNLKEITATVLDVRYNLSRKDIDLRERINEFKNQLEIDLNYKKNLNQKKAAAISSLMEANKNKEIIKSKEENLKNQKSSVFKNNLKLYQDSLNNLNKTNINLNKQLKFIQEYLTINEEILTKQQNEIINQYNFVIDDLEEKLIISNIWERSPKAISLKDLQKAFLDAETFLRNIFWDTNKYLSPSVLFYNIKDFKIYNYFWLLVFFAFFFVSLFLLKFILLKTQEEVKKIINKKPSSFLYLSQTLVEFALDHLKLLWGYLFIVIHITFDFKYIFSTISPIINPYLLSVFHIVSIPILIYLSKELLDKLKILNEKLGFSIFTEKFQNQFIFLASITLYSTAILLPLRKAFLSYSAESTEFPNVLIAAYILILALVLLFAVNKEDVLKLIPDNKFFVWIKKQIDAHYYPAFIFIMGLIIISNPYIGYSNLAWYLAFVIPFSLAVIYGIFFLHAYIRKYSLFFFLTEEGDELQDKFEYAKTYYGFFIIASFMFISFFAFFFLSRIWNFYYTPTDFWDHLSNDWVITIGENHKLGIVQFISFITFIISGFITSTLVNKFILNKLFDVFRTEPGTQNTLSRITHYLIIIISIMLGFTAMHLGVFIGYASTALFLGAGIGLKDLILDFVGGFFILIERPIEIGHFIETGEVRGTVHRISPRATTIRTARNFSIIIPNKDLITKPIINWGQGRFAVGFEMMITVSYGSDPIKVKEILLQTIQKNPVVLRVPGISIRMENFLEDGMQFFIRAFVSARKVRDQWDVASDLRFAIIETFKEHNIEIPFPQTVVHFAKNKDEFVKAIDIKFDKNNNPPETSK